MFANKQTESIILKFGISKKYNRWEFKLEKLIDKAMIWDLILRQIRQLDIIFSKILAKGLKWIDISMVRIWLAKMQLRDLKYRIPLNQVWLTIFHEFITIWWIILLKVMLRREFIHFLSLEYLLNFQISSRKMEFRSLMTFMKELQTG